MLCKCIVKVKEVNRHITEEVEVSSEEQDESDEKKFSLNKRFNKSLTSMNTLRSVYFCFCNILFLFQAILIL